MGFNRTWILYERIEGLFYLRTKSNFYLTMGWIKTIYIIKSNVISNQTLDQLGGGIIANKIILPIKEFRTLVLMNSPIGKFYPSKWGNPYEYPKEILGCNAHMRHHIVVFGICYHMDYL